MEGRVDELDVGVYVGFALYSAVIVIGVVMLVYFLWIYLVMFIMF